jgi:hypothetical protein
MYFCTVKKSRIINAFVVLGTILKELSENNPYSAAVSMLTEEEYAEVNEVIQREFHYNGWFTEDSIRQAFGEIASWLTTEKLTEWTNRYPEHNDKKNVAVIMAGNIPLVGFHDFLCVLLSGHQVICTQSSEDARLLPALVKLLLLVEPDLEERIRVSDRKLVDYDAVIATGSNNSMRYFESYFGKYPHIFRKNRTSLAIFDGSETEEQIHALGKDIFTYFSSIQSIFLIS